MQLCFNKFSFPGQLTKSSVTYKSNVSLLTVMKGAKSRFILSQFFNFFMIICVNLLLNKPRVGLLFPLRRFFLSYQSYIL